MEVLIQPFEWKDGDDIRTDRYNIRIWGHVAPTDGSNIANQIGLIRVEGFQPFVLLELPLNIDGVAFQWTIEKLKAYKQWMIDRLHYCMPKSVSFRPMKSLYYYKKDPDCCVLTCSFDSYKHMKQFIAYFNNDRDKPTKFMVPGLGKIIPTIREDNIDQIHKFITEYNLLYGGWTLVRGNVIKDGKYNRYDNIIEVVIDCKMKGSISLCNDINRTSGLKVNFRIMSFDIETYSQNHNRFPDKELLTDCVTMISVVMKNYYDQEPYRKIMLVLGWARSIPGVIMYRFQDELSMLKYFFHIIDQEDPTIITGYNIYNFDLSYIKARLDLLDAIDYTRQDDNKKGGYSHREWNNINCTRMAGHVIHIEEQAWESSGAGQMNIVEFKCEGRLTIDMYYVTRREHPSLQEHNLDYVSRYFLKRGKHDVSAKHMFETFHLMMKLQKKYVNQVHIIEKLLDEPDPDWSIIPGHKDISDFLDEQNKVILYALEDSCLPPDLMINMNQGIVLIESSSIYNVSASEIYNRGQQIRIQNQLYRLCVAENPRIMMNKRETLDTNGYKGAYVYDPDPGLHHMAGVLDFNSLYPSIIQAYNLCLTTIVPINSIPADQYEIYEPEECDEKGKVLKIHQYAFVKDSTFPGLLPRMCRTLVNERKAVREQMKSIPKDSIMQTVLNSRQLALKVLANSIYGALGVSKGGRCPLREAAQTICYLGRKLNLEARDYVQGKGYGQVIYGDTDSIMIVLNNCPDDRQKVVLFRQIEKEVNAQFAGKLVMELEKVYARLLCQSKKFYTAVHLVEVKWSDIQDITKVNDSVFGPIYKIQTKTKTTYLAIRHDINQEYPFVCGIAVDEHGTLNEYNITKKGHMLARRDGCKWVKEGYHDCLYTPIYGGTMQNIMDIFHERTTKLLQCQVGKENLAISKTLGTYAENCTSPFKLFKEIQQGKGKPIEKGEKVKYLLVRCEDPDLDAKQGNKIRLFRDVDGSEPIDHVHYVKLLSNALTTLLKILYSKELEQSEKDHFERYNGKVKPKVKNYQPVSFRKLLGIDKNNKNQIHIYNSVKYFERYCKLLKAKQDMHRELIKLIRPMKLYYKVDLPNVVIIHETYESLWKLRKKGAYIV